LAVTASPSALPLVRATDLSSTQDSRWLVRDLWPRAALGFIAGPGACGETELALDLCISVASGAHCLDHFQIVEPGPVLACFAADPASTLRQRVAVLCAHRRLELATLDLHFVDQQHLRIDLAEAQARLLQVIIARKPKLLVLDPLSAMHRLNENCAAQIGPPLAWLHRLSAEHQVAIAIVHHTVKRRARHIGHALRGSSVLSNSADTFAFLEPRDGQSLLTLEHRAVAARPPLRLALAREREHSRYLRPIFDPVGPPDVRVLLEDRILEALRKAQSPLSRVALRARLGVNNARLGDALLALERDGRLLRSDSGWRSARQERGPAPASPIDQLDPSFEKPPAAHADSLPNPKETSR
jgi:hypothetical protein